ncbi:predicted protein [Chaetomium globosum CBS 148.51]|uniref:Chitin-binding type-1 domain-containing protein n=1 Tax=Chaetomium globosum (strain ATCC 6205 / CBS 148.51 / DSM 1962 / NBRC 6347 / NRRL 1970) TaxID=306901 RepID=Q2GPJ3_CHAGB|nr:uncharacterized protein CHGG_10111 [Chaetomium globosum CBS 148.51]EAQ83707.1 predicted protein [Chaetomium globosum CBS 148.51]
MSPQNPGHAYGVALVALLSLIPAAQAQSACGLQGYSSCLDGTRTDYGCCPTGWECFATECSYTGTSTMSARPTTTACPGVPAHHLCPQSLGGNCCYNAYGCDPDNVSQCILTQTQRVFEVVRTSTTVVDGSTQTITSTTIDYPWPTVTPRATVEGTASSEETTTAPGDHRSGGHHGADNDGG